MIVAAVDEGDSGHQAGTDDQFAARVAIRSCGIPRLGGVSEEAQVAGEWPQQPWHQQIFDGALQPRLACEDGNGRAQDIERSIQVFQANGQDSAVGAGQVVQCQILKHLVAEAALAVEQDNHCCSGVAPTAGCSAVEAMTRR